MNGLNPQGRAEALYHPCLHPKVRSEVDRGLEAVSILPQIGFLSTGTYLVVAPYVSEARWLGLLAITLILRNRYILTGCPILR